MFHDTNSNCGHYESLLHKNLPAMNIERSNDYLSLVCKDVENYWISIVDELFLHQLHRPITIISNCGDSIFTTICQLITTTKFHVQYLILYIVQTFYYATMGKCKDALVSLKKYLTKSTHVCKLANIYYKYGDTI